MNQQATLQTAPRLNKVKSAFKAWRTTKEKGNRIPECLWEDAAALGRIPIFPVMMPAGRYGNLPFVLSNPNVLLYNRTVALAFFPHFLYTRKYKDL